MAGAQSHSTRHRTYQFRGHDVLSRIRAATLADEALRAVSRGVDDRGDAILPEVSVSGEVRGAGAQSGRLAGNAPIPGIRRHGALGQAVLKDGRRTGPRPRLCPQDRGDWRGWRAAAVQVIG